VAWAVLRERSGRGREAEACWGQAPVDQFSGTATLAKLLTGTVFANVITSPEGLDTLCMIDQEWLVPAA
jgi:hypothetical protein